MNAAAPNLDAARAYVARGWHVFPLAHDTKGKFPSGQSSHLLKRGFRDASVEPGQIEAWWRQWPDANIGLNLVESGLLAIDVDLYKPDCGWNAFVSGKDIPKTFVQDSASGGRHYLFASAPNETFPGQVCHGVDLKHHGYILLAPSTFEGRLYQIYRDVDPAPCPDWVPRKHHPPAKDIAIDLGRRESACRQEVEELLSWIDPDAGGYAQWIEVLQAIHAHFGGRSNGLEIAANWSCSGPLFKPGEIETKWADFGTDGGVTIKSLAHLARRNGADLSAIARKYRSACAMESGTKTATLAQSAPTSDALTLDSDHSHDRLAVELGVACFDQDARYVATEGLWYFWTGTRWRADKSLEHLTKVRRFLRDRAASIAGSRSEGPSSGRSRKIDYLKSHKTVTAVAALARANPASTALAETFDRDLMLLGTPDGAVDLQTGKLRSAFRSDLISRLASCGPAASGTRPTHWLSFLNDVMDGDTETIGFLQRAAGYALTGATTEHKLLFLHGSGRNGKSVFLNALLDIWGDYGRRVAAGTFLSSHTERHPTDLASLRGARLAIASELPRGKCWDEAVIKDLTGGDRMTARFMRQDFFEFDPQLTLMVAGNVQPSFRGVDTAIRSRVVLVPFNVTFPPERQNHDLPKELAKEAPAILRWCIDGAIAWQRRGLDVPERLRQASQDYFDEEDIIGQFLLEMTTDDPGGYVSSADLILQFNHWLDLQGLSPWTKTTLTKELRSRGYPDDRTSSSRGLRGLKFK